MSVLRKCVKLGLVMAGTTTALIAGACIQKYKDNNSNKSLLISLGLGMLSGACIGTAAAMDKKDIINQTLDEIDFQLMKAGFGHIVREGE